MILGGKKAENVILVEDEIDTKKHCYANRRMCI